MIPNHLKGEGTPKVIQNAIKLFGIREIPGTKSNPKIIAMADHLGLSEIYTSDDTAWCGLAHGYVLTMAGKELPFKSKYDYLRAKAYAAHGERVTSPEVGDTLVFERPGGFHVGFYAGESKDAYYVLGGNQSNMYCFTWIAKDRLYSARRPNYTVKPTGVKKVFLNRDGSLSQNEA